MSNEYPIRAVKTALDVVEALLHLDGAGVSELSDHLDVPKSTVHDYLNTLTKTGYVVKDGSDYSIGFRFLELGERLCHNTTLIQVADPELKKLAESTKEHVTLIAEENGEGVIIATERGGQAVNLSIFRGMRLTMHSTAPGKAILAHQPTERVEEILDTHGMKSYTEYTITCRETLHEELEEIRNQGYALDDEERIYGMRSVATPIVDRSNTVHGAITVSGPTQRITDEQFTGSIPQRLLERSNVIEVSLSYD